jgi:hypothetical protein
MYSAAQLIWRSSQSVPRYPQLCLNHFVSHWGFLCPSFCENTLYLPKSKIGGRCLVTVIKWPSESCWKVACLLGAEWRYRKMTQAFAVQHWVLDVLGVIGFFLNSGLLETTYPRMPGVCCTVFMLLYLIRWYMIESKFRARPTHAWP